VERATETGSYRNRTVAISDHTCYGRFPKSSEATKNLDSINTAERPSPVILDRLLAKLFPFFFPGKHTIVSAITPAIPVFPFQIEWFLKVPATIRNVPISSELAVLKALASYTSSLLTVLHTVPRWQKADVNGIYISAKSQRMRYQQSHR